jgi:protoheme IX farnesyltransferase
MERPVLLARLTLAWNLVTILLGALVRATHSGAGCGASWPTCHGQLLPPLAGATAIEYTHRAASGLALLTVGVLWLVVRRHRAVGDPARKAAGLAGLAVVLEALIGAAIVLFEWVGADRSLARGISVPFHLTNTLFLLACLTMTIWFLSGGGRPVRRGRLPRWLLAGALALVALAATGAVTALADTLFPVAAGAQETTEHFLTRLRIVHPILALSVVGLAVILGRSRRLVVGVGVTRLAALTGLQVCLGFLNIWLGTPVWLQLLHLLIADLIWIAYVWFSAQLLTSDLARDSGESVGTRQTRPAQT